MYFIIQISAVPLRNAKRTCHTLSWVLRGMGLAVCNCRLAHCPKEGTNSITAGQTCWNING